MFVFAEAIGCVACWRAVCLCLLKLLAVSRAGGLCVCLLKLLAVSRAGGLCVCVC